MPHAGTALVRSVQAPRRALCKHLVNHHHLVFRHLLRRIVCSTSTFELPLRLAARRPAAGARAHATPRRRRRRRRTARFSVLARRALMRFVSTFDKLCFQKIAVISREIELSSTFCSGHRLFPAVHFYPTFHVSCVRGRRISRETTSLFEDTPLHWRVIEEIISHRFRIIPRCGKSRDH